MPARHPSPLRLVWLAALCAACLLTSCREEGPPAVRTANAEYGFSIVLPPGWPIFQEKTRDCLVRLGAKGGDGGLIYVCVRPRPPQFATSSSDFVNRDQVKSYVEETLLGHHVESRPITVQGRQAYEALYLRDVAAGPKGPGTVRKQFVNQTFFVRGDLLYAVTSYAMGATEAAAHAAFNLHSEVVLRSVMTFFLQNGNGLPAAPSAPAAASGP